MHELGEEYWQKPLFLGIDGGQSHTEALVADAAGRILGRGLGGPSNHAEQPGGRERLRRAVVESVSRALALADWSFDAPVAHRFRAAHCGMTGGAVYKEEIIGALLSAEHLTVGHDAPTALYGATSGRAGVVVIAGTGSVVYGENAAGRAARAGGLGFLFSDEGSGFWLALETIRGAIREQDGLAPAAGLEALVLSFFEAGALREVTDAFYNGKLARDRVAALARAAHDAAAAGNEALRGIIARGTGVLAESVAAVARRLEFDAGFPVAGVGGMFRGALFRAAFIENLRAHCPAAVFTAPRFGPATGALLVAYRQAGVEITGEILDNLEKTQLK